MLKVSVLQLFCFIEFYRVGQLHNRVGQLYSDKHLTSMMSNKCFWYISTRECLNRKNPHPSWELQKHTCTQSPTNAQHCWHFNAQCSCINTTQCVIYWTVMPMYNFFHTNSYQNDNKWQHFRAQKPRLKGLWTYLRVQREGHCASGPVVGPDLRVIIHHVFVSISQQQPYSWSDNSQTPSYPIASIMVNRLSRSHTHSYRHTPSASAVDGTTNEHLSWSATLQEWKGEGANE